MRLLRNCSSFVFLFAFAASFAHAQNGLDAYFGVGTANASSNGQSIDTFQDGTLYRTPHLNGVFGKVGADLMLTPHFGFGGEADFRFTQAGYAGLNYRPTFYDFYGIWEPISRKRVVPQIEAGIGAANLRFFYPTSYCDQFAGCSSSNSYIESSNHFQTHLGLGLNLYATNHIFFRPQIDAHWVNNFYQFGSSWVPEYSVAVGYRFGER